jgi:hypothetical protein
MKVLRPANWINIFRGFPRAYSVCRDQLVPKTYASDAAVPKLTSKYPPSRSPPNLTKIPSQCCPPNTNSAQLLSFSPRCLLPTVHLPALPSTLLGFQFTFVLFSPASTTTNAALANLYHRPLHSLTCVAVHKNLRPARLTFALW